jgi:hypothetical protein
MDVEVDLDAPACLALTAHLHRPPSAGRWAAARLVAVALARAAFDLPQPGGPTMTGDLVITRVDTGTEVWRLETDTNDAELLPHVRGQLDELTVAEFLDAWGIDPDALERDGSGSE